MIFQTELEQNSDVAAYASLSFVKAEDRSYDEKKVNLHLKLTVSFQSQISCSVVPYSITAEFLQEDTHSHLYLC